MAQGLVDVGETKEVELLKSDNAFDDNFEESFDNNMYRFNKKEGSDGVYNIKLVKTAEDVALENGGSKENGEMTKAWVDSERFGKDANVTLKNGSKYKISSEKLDDFGVELGVNAYYKVYDNLELGLGYKARLRNKYKEHTGMMGVKYNF